MSDHYGGERSGNTAAILLASGFSKRFGGQNKLLAVFRRKPLARYALELAASINFWRGIFFIIASDEVAALAADLPCVKVIKNSSPQKGLRESICLGIEAAFDAEYYMFFPCDMPFLDAGTVQSILNERRPGCIVEPHYRGVPGNPCLFSAVFREKLLSLKEDETPRLLKLRHPEVLRKVEVTNPLVLEDIDDEETFERWSLT